MHSVKANYSAFQGGNALSLPAASCEGLSRETIEPRLAACDWNPELTFRFFRALIEMDGIVLMEMLLHAAESVRRSN